MSVSINDASRLSGIDVFPATIDDAARRVDELRRTVRARENLTIRTGADVAAVTLDGRRFTGVTLRLGEHIDADEVVVSCGTLWTPHLLMRSGIGPADHLAERHRRRGRRPGRLDDEPPPRPGDPVRV